VKRVVAQELTLNFVPDAAQRLWRTVMRRKYQITRTRVQLDDRLECLLKGHVEAILCRFSVAQGQSASGCSSSCR
jgi:hypothetical protein